MIILNERSWVSDVLNKRELGSKPSETLFRIAKVDLANGYTKTNTIEHLENFILMCDPTVSIPKWSKTIGYIVNGAKKSPVVELDGVTITEPEMKVVDSLPSRQIKRLAFTLLCLAKYHDAASSNDGHWANCDDSEVAKLANIRSSASHRCLMYNTLYKLGLIDFPKKVDNTNIKVLFVSDGEPVLKVSDFRSLGNQYLMYHGEPFLECRSCGIITKRIGNNQKYCPNCAPKIELQHRVDSVMRIRAAKK